MGTSRGVCGLENADPDHASSLRMRCGCGTVSTDSPAAHAHCRVSVVDFALLGSPLTQLSHPGQTPLVTVVRGLGNPLSSPSRRHHSMATYAKMPRVSEWEALMHKYQEKIPAADGDTADTAAADVWWRPCTQVYHLD